MPTRVAGEPPPPNGLQFDPDTYKDDFKSSDFHIEDFSSMEPALLKKLINIMGSATANTPFSREMNAQVDNNYLPVSFLNFWYVGTGHLLKDYCAGNTDEHERISVARQFLKKEHYVDGLEIAQHSMHSNAWVLESLSSPSPSLAGADQNNKPAAAPFTITSLENASLTKLGLFMHAPLTGTRRDVNSGNSRLTRQPKHGFWTQGQPLVNSRPTQPVELIDGNSGEGIIPSLLMPDDDDAPRNVQPPHVFLYLVTEAPAGLSGNTQIAKVCSLYKETNSNDIVDDGLLAVPFTSKNDPDIISKCIKPYYDMLKKVLKENWTEALPTDDASAALQMIWAMLDEPPFHSLRSYRQYMCLYVLLLRTHGIHDKISKDVVDKIDGKAPHHEEDEAPDRILQGKLVNASLLIPSNFPELQHRTRMLWLALQPMRAAVVDGGKRVVAEIHIGLNLKPCEEPWRKLHSLNKGSQLGGDSSRYTPDKLSNKIKIECINWKPHGGISSKIFDECLALSFKLRSANDSSARMSLKECFLGILVELGKSPFVYKRLARQTPPQDNRGEIVANNPTYLMKDLVQANIYAIHFVHKLLQKNSSQVAKCIWGDAEKERVCTMIKNAKEAHKKLNRDGCGKYPTVALYLDGLEKPRQRNGDFKEERECFDDAADLFHSYPPIFQELPTCTEFPWHDLEHTDPVLMDARVRRGLVWNIRTLKGFGSRPTEKTNLRNVTKCMQPLTLFTSLCIHFVMDDSSLEDMKKFASQDGRSMACTMFPDYAVEVVDWSNYGNRTARFKEKLYQPKPTVSIPVL